MDEARIARLEELLQETLELTEENNKILMAMQRSARWAFWGKVVLWIAVIVLPILVLAPILHSLVPASNTGGSVFGLPSQQQFQDLIKAYQQ